MAIASIWDYRKCSPEPEDPVERDYHQARERILTLLIRHALIESYQKFSKAHQPYPFVSPTSLRPGSITASREYALHNHALLILVNGILPDSLRKNFRCREANRVSKKNIQVVAPDLPDTDHYESSMRNVNDEEFDVVLRLLLELDYALLVQRLPEEDDQPGDFQLTHFHVKIERLTDSALNTLGQQLHYLDRKGNLYQHGEAFVEALEKKFFEYFNFYRNAAGRRSASALASQLLSRRGVDSTVFVASQEDRRLTVMTTRLEANEVDVEQFLLLRLDREELRSLIEWGKEQGLNIPRHYLVGRFATHGVVVFRVRYEHTDAAKPSPDGTLKLNLNLREKWVRIQEEAIIPIHPAARVRIGYPVAYRRHEED